MNSHLLCSISDNFVKSIIMYIRESIGQYKMKCFLCYRGKIFEKQSATVLAFLEILSP